MPTHGKRDRYDLLDDGTPTQYWLIKNSWDYTWGDSGYFRMEAFKNMCGVADCNSFPDLYGA